MLNIFNAINSYIKSIIGLESHISLSSEVMMDIFTKLEKEEFTKNTLLVKPGYICKHVYFIEKGAARIFYYKDEKDVTDGFSYDQKLLVSIISFIRQVPDKRGIELLDDSVIWKLSYSDLEQLSNKNTEIQQLYRLAMSSLLISTQSRVDKMLFQSADERYEDFVKSYPKAYDFLTLGMIASFLGITQETLSRIRSKNNLQ
ncbi:Crp/Fnr family transcriptional regulator [Chryseobacterium arthrosphaerae]|uniref:Crp/Fnr family transcriptional regulator n=1 Tax=Chryseobacterium arthrosphaerae TaxID=651561 RepID=A0ABU7R6A1_9FLAO|nr:Crp/Fnr family transcriptional regulator [Chryseobacterium arthrosphaerae]